MNTTNLQPSRTLGLDALRGLAVVGMLLVDNRGSAAMPAQFVHASWNGLRVADVVFPFFLFAVGASMELSSRTRNSRAVLMRALGLTAIGFFLVAVRSHNPGPSFGVLQHIAAAYIGCWLLLQLPRRIQTPATIATLALLCAVYAFGPWAGYQAGHNTGSWFVVRVLHLSFSAETPQSYVGSAVSVYLGVVAVRRLRHGWNSVSRFAVMCAGSGIALLPLVPLNKRLWTPSFVLLTTGLAAAVLVLLHVIADRRRVDLGPLVTLGQHALTIFVFSEIVFRTILAGAQPHVVDAIATFAGPASAAFGYAALSVVAASCLCVGIERRKRVDEPSLRRVGPLVTARVESMSGSAL